MLENVFNWLYTAINSTPEIALLGSLLWGVLSIILSPCHLASIPLIVGFIDKQGIVSTKRAFFIASFFSIGILITITIVGFVTGLAGRILGDVGPYVNYFVAVIFFLVGFYLIGIVPLPSFGQSGQPSLKRKGILAAFILGLIFGIALGPCTFAYMAPMLGIVFSVASTKLLFALSLILAYAIGHCSIIVFAGTFINVVQKYLKWNETSKGVFLLRRLCGVFVVFIGVYILIMKL